jgi:hypothetical protein
MKVPLWGRFFIGARWTGFLLEHVGPVCLEHVGPVREWTTDDRDFASALADFIASRFPARAAVAKLSYGRVLTIAGSLWISAVG